MKCFVTGIAGFVGSSLGERLLSEGHTVTGVDVFTDYYSRESKERNLEKLRGSDDFNFVEGDLAALDLKELLEGVDWVFHQAAQAGVRASWGSYFETYVHHNILATQRLLETIASFSTRPRVIYASSSSVYGNAESFPTSEDLVPQPVSPYGVTKLAAEHLMMLYASEFDVPTVSLRYFTVFGPRQRPDMAFHRFIRAALKGEPITLYGDGEQTRDFTFIDDIVTANILAAESSEHGKVYNVGGGEVISINQVLQYLEGEIGKIEIERHPRQRGDARHTSASTERIAADLGFSPRISVRDGIRKEIEWIQDLLSTE